MIAETPPAHVARVPHETVVLADFGSVRIVTRPNGGAAPQPADLDEVEREYLATIHAVFFDPALAATRARLRAGEVFICIEGDEITFCDAESVATDLAARIAIAATKEDAP